MPLPIAHALVGATLAEILLPRDVPRRRQKILAFGCLAVIPDLDFFPVWFLGLDRDWHRGFSHSIVAAICISSPALFMKSATRIKEMAICALAVASHGLLDAATTIQGRGIALLWPLSSHRVKFGVTDIWERSPEWMGAGEVARLLQISVLELILLGPLLAGLIWFHRRMTLKTPEP